MASNSRAENQYYGKYRECCVIAHLHHAEVEYLENYDIPEKEREDIFEKSKIVSNFIGKHTATYIGNHTINESGDILLDNGDRLELKSVSAGTGTYHNTSIYYFEKFGFNFRDYMERYGLYDILEKTFGDMITINRNIKSPVNQTDSSFIRHNYEKLYKEKIVPVDETMRMEFTKDLATYFINNPDKRYSFITEMLDKESCTHKKISPDRLIIWNYQKNNVYEIDLKNFKGENSTDIRATDKGLVIGNVRCAFSWGNGAGLNNPVIRVFLINK